MEGTMKFYLVRHADKAKGDYFNPQLRHHDQPISVFGRQQASKVKKYFNKHAIKSIYVSEYIRTEQTVRPLARRLKIVPIVDYRLNEIDVGIIDRLSEEEIRDQYPDIWNASQDWNRDFQWPEGETGLEAQARIVSFINEHINQEGCILVVAHDGIIRLLLCYVLGLPVYNRARFQVDTASVTEIELEKTKSKWKLIRFNQSVL
jgi:probable phosphoglycerate mutase